MRGLRRNKTTLYYALYQGQTDIIDANGNITGEPVPTYSEPVEVRMYVTPASGNAEWEPFGLTTPYTKIALTFDMNSPITETSKVRIDKSIDEPANYVVTGLAKSLNCISYALLEVKDG